jgi:Domain of unknown function (DUF4136)
MKVLRALLTCSILMLPALAIAQDVKTDFDKGYNFSAVKTYSIRIGTGWNNDISEKRVLGEFSEAIASKGWKKVDSGADVEVILHGATQTKHTANTFYSGMGGGYGAYGYGGMGGMGMATATTTTSEYTVGTLVVDMFDPKTKKLVFRGTASDEISDKPEKNVKKIEKASDKMFKNFPPGSAKK